MFIKSFKNPLEFNYVIIDNYNGYKNHKMLSQMSKHNWDSILVFMVVFICIGPILGHFTLLYHSLLYINQ